MIEQPDEKIKGRTQIVIGIIACGLLLLSVALQAHSVYVEHEITTNRDLLLQMGYSPEAFPRHPAYWATWYGFHAFGAISLLLYLIYVSSKRLKPATVMFGMCSVYFVTVAVINITALTYEEQVRGLTFGGWIAKAVSWLPKYLVELGLLIQGVLGVKKYTRTRSALLTCPAERQAINREAVK